MSTYRHTQPGWAVIIPLLGVLVVIWSVTEPGSENRAVMPWIAAAMAGVLSLFATLTVTVADDRVRCRFGVGLIRRQIRLSEVRSAEAVRNKWYYGWGIRLTPHGWLWNVSGLDAVELTFANGKRFRIGTDQPERLLAAIRAGLSRANPSA
jgi:hypothetical protein